MTLLAQASTMSGREGDFVGFVDRALADPGLIAAAVGLAFVVGAAHALAPGHGKAVTAAYLVGGRGRARDALLLGAVVAAMHSASVIVLALGLQLALRGSALAPASAAAVTPALRLISGLAVVALGAALLVAQWRRRNDHQHDHTTPEPFTRGGLVALGLAGGLLPSPSAFLVLVTTAFSGRLLLGLVLVLVFSLGLAATLTALGLAVVRGREALVDRLGTATQRRLLRGAALGGAVAVFAGGIVLTAAGISAL